MTKRAQISKVIGASPSAKSRAALRAPTRVLERLDVDLCTWFELEARFDPRQQCTDALRVSGPACQELRRFGERRPGDERKGDGARAPDEQQHAPAFVAAQIGADSGGHDRAERDPEIHDDDERGADPLRRIFGRQRDAGAGQAAEPDARQETQDDEHRQRLGPECRDQREDAVDQAAEDDRAATSPPVADRGKQRAAAEHPEQACAQHRAEVGPAHVPRPDDARRREGRRLQIVAVGQHDQKAERDDEDVHPPKRLAIEEAFEIERSRRGRHHTASGRGMPQKFVVSTPGGHVLGALRVVAVPGSCIEDAGCFVAHRIELAEHFDNHVRRCSCGRYRCCGQAHGGPVPRRA